MKLWMSWVGHKCVDNKHYIWGVLKEEFEDKWGKWSNTYTFSAHCDTAYVNMNIDTIIRDPVGVYHLKEKKETEGYKRIDQITVEREWPDVMEEIEMQFVMKRLKNA